MDGTDTGSVHFHVVQYREEIMKKSVLIAAALVAGLSLSACNTVEGAGKDVSSAGKAVSKTAKDVKN